MASLAWNLLIRLYALAIASYWISISTIVTLGRVLPRNPRTSVVIRELSLDQPNTRQLKRKHHVALSLNLETFSLPPSLFAYKASRSTASTHASNSTPSSVATLDLASRAVSAITLDTIELAARGSAAGNKSSSLTRLRLFVSHRQLERLSLPNPGSRSQPHPTHNLALPSIAKKRWKYERPKLNRASTVPMDRHAISHHVACTHGLHDT